MTQSPKLLDVIGAEALLAQWRPTEMTANTAPEWLKELSPEDYARRRNDENREALRSLEFHGDWLKTAASQLYSAGAFSGSEFDSYGHTCFIVADALMGTREALLAAEQPGGAIPREPTPEMLDAGEQARIDNTDRYFDGSEVAGDVVPAIWAAMLDAAPPSLAFAEQSGAGEEGQLAICERDFAALLKDYNRAARLIELMRERWAVVSGELDHIPDGMNADLEDAATALATAMEEPLSALAAPRATAVEREALIELLGEAELVGHESKRRPGLYQLDTSGLEALADAILSLIRGEGK